jgi:hypothetical protein
LRAFCGFCTVLWYFEWRSEAETVNTQTPDVGYGNDYRKIVRLHSVIICKRQEPKITRSDSGFVVSPFHDKTVKWMGTQIV